MRSFTPDQYNCARERQPGSCQLMECACFLLGMKDGMLNGSKSAAWGCVSVCSGIPADCNMIVEREGGLYVGSVHSPPHWRAASARML